MRKLFTTSLIALVGAFGLAGCGSTAPTQHVYHTKYGVQPHSSTFGVPPSNPALRPGTVLGVPTLGMLDAISSSTSIFSGLNPTVVAGYTSGNWPTYFDYKGHFKYVVAIMVNVQHFGVHGAAASCLDDEPGDATPGEAGPWVVHEINNGFRPCVYASLSNMPAIKGSIVNSGVSLSKVMLWDADWTYSYHLDSGYAATQWTNHYSGRNIDGSAVSYAFVSYHSKPKPPPVPTVRCYRKGWPVPASAKATCLKVRSHDAFLGQERSREAGYLKVTNQNIAKLQARQKLETSRESTYNSQLQADLKKYGFTG